MTIVWQAQSYSFKPFQDELQLDVRHITINTRFIIIFTVSFDLYFENYTVENGLKNLY